MMTTDAPRLSRLTDRDIQTELDGIEQTLPELRPVWAAERIRELQAEIERRRKGRP